MSLAQNLTGVGYGLRKIFWGGIKMLGKFYIKFVKITRGPTKVNIFFKNAVFSKPGGLDSQDQLRLRDF